MRCDFAKDENGTIWFTYAQNIQARRIEDVDIKITIEIS